jgi:hypothetical protein
MTQAQPQEAISKDAAALQVEIALLCRKLEDAEKSERAMREAYCSLEAQYTHTDDDEAFERLAEAFATLEELQHYLNDAFYNRLADASMDLFTDTQWQSKPHLMRKILPILLQELIEMQDALKAAGGEKKGVS